MLFHSINRLSNSDRYICQLKHTLHTTIDLVTFETIQWQLQIQVSNIYFNHQTLLNKLKQMSTYVTDWEFLRWEILKRHQPRETLPSIIIKVFEEISSIE